MEKLKLFTKLLQGLTGGASAKYPMLNLPKPEKKIGIKLHGNRVKPPIKKS